ncbi:MAG: choice-of-anchor D domain-containing protein [Myxococcaceae bacterium]|nr:choice-of-anchor D domain-containing protein [Myxococcaceae bacterium]
MARGIRRAVMGALALQAGLLGACHDGDYVRNVHATAVFDQAALDFGRVPVGEWREKEITVRNVGYVPFSLIEALELEDNPSFVVEAKRDLIRSGETRAVKVRFHPVREGEITASVKVDVDARNRPEEPVRLRGVGAPAEVIVDPPQLEFETLEVDSERTLPVTIANPGDLPLSVSLKGEDASEFRADKLTIPPFGKVKLSATFRPKTVGARAARIEINACGDCTPSVVPMTGRSVPSAFEFKPSPVPFQDTPVHETSRSWTQMTNVTWRPVKVLTISTSDQAFHTLTDLTERTVQPGESVKVDMEFAARFAGPNVGKMMVDYLSDRTRRSEVMLDARGGQPQLALTPIDIDFGRVPKGGKVEATVRLTNAGANGDLHFVGVRGEGPGVAQFNVGPATTPDGTEHPYSGGAWPDVVAPDVPIAPGDDFLDVKVFFEPTAVGDFQATLVFRSDAIFNAERTVTVKGSAWDTGTCKWRVLPWPELDFGNVPPRQEGVLGFRFENAGTDICAVKDIHLSHDGGGVFFMPGGALTGGVVLQDDAFSAMIGFYTKTAGTFTGELELTVNDPAAPVIKLPLRAISTDSCIVANPRPLDFGPIRYDCQPEPRTTLVSNACSVPVTIRPEDITLDPGTSEQFHITRKPTAPVTLQPGEGFELEVTYDRTVLGQHYAGIKVKPTNEAVPYLIPLWAETNHEGSAVDRFVQGQANQLDVLFVVSNTTTMQPWQQRLQQAIPGWLAEAEAAGLSMQVGVTTTGLVERSPACGGGANGGEAGRLFPVDGSRERIVQGTPARATTLQENVAVGLCHNLPQGLETMRMALSTPLIDHVDDPRTLQANDGNAGFLRPSARLAVVFVADEDDYSGFDPKSYVKFLQSLKGPNMSHRTQAYALVPDAGGVCGAGQTAGGPAVRYMAVASGTGGASASICGGVSTYQALLSRVLARAAGPQADFTLTFQAAGAADIQVLVDGVEAPKENWTYDAGRNAVIFTSGHVPAPGQNIEVRYSAQCGVVTQ